MSDHKINVFFLFPNDSALKQRPLLTVSCVPDTVPGHWKPVMSKADVCWPNDTHISDSGKGVKRLNQEIVVIRESVEESDPDLMHSELPGIKQTLKAWICFPEKGRKLHET